MTSSSMATIFFFTSTSRASRFFSSTSYLRAVFGRRDVGEVERGADVLRVRVRANVSEERDQFVVVGLRDRVDLVVVAPGAVERGAEERLPRGGDDVVVAVEERCSGSAGSSSQMPSR